MAQNHTAKKVLQGSVVMLMTQGASMLLYFLAQRIILSELTKDANGLLFAERRMVDLIMLIAVDFGLNGIAMRRSIQHPDQAAEILSSAVAMRLALWVPASLVALIYAAIAGYDILDVVLWCVFCILSGRATVLRYMIEIPYRNAMRFSIPGFLGLFDAVLFTGFIWLFRDALSPSVVIYCFVASALPGFIFMVLLDRGRSFRLSHVQSWLMRDMVKEAIPLIAMISLVAIHDKIDAIMLDWWSAPSEVGVFGAAYVTMAPLTAALPMAITYAVIPVISAAAKRDAEQCARYVSIVLRGLIVIAILSSAILTQFVPELIQLVSKGRYADNVLHFTLFLWTPLPIFILAYAQDVVVALNRSRSLVVVGIVLAGITIVGCIALIPMFHALGATIVKVVSVTIGAITASIVLRSAVDRRISLKILYQAGIVVGVVVIGSLLLPSILEPWAVASCNGALALGTSLIVGLITAGEVKSFLGLLQRRAEVAS